MTIEELRTKRTALQLEWERNVRVSTARIMVAQNLNRKIKLIDVRIAELERASLTRSAVAES